RPTWVIPLQSAARAAGRRKKQGKQGGRRSPGQASLRQRRAPTRRDKKERSDGPRCGHPCFCTTDLYFFLSYLPKGFAPRQLIHINTGKYQGLTMASPT